VKKKEFVCLGWGMKMKFFYFSFSASLLFLCWVLLTCDKWIFLFFILSYIHIYIHLYIFYFGTEQMRKSWNVMLSQWRFLMLVIYVHMYIRVIENLHDIGSKHFHAIFALFLTADSFLLCGNIHINLHYFIHAEKFATSWAFSSFFFFRSPCVIFFFFAPTYIHLTRII
jgi:hypothetical protein